MDARTRQRRRHWDGIWASRTDDELSWFQASPTIALRWIEKVARPRDAILDVGGGNSRLAATLARRGYRDLTVIDLSRPALERARRRAGSAADRIRWTVADATRLRPLPPIAVWHDRAVFHFLTRAEERRRYLRRALASVRPGGHLIFATFGPEGPRQCSGLPVRRYSLAALGRELGDGVRPIAHRAESHRTPFGTRQPFLYTLWRRVGAPGAAPAPRGASARGSPSPRT